ncbi:hypothetical protein BKA70DRAFT_67489 [Coprinopsis sp. MPI-PUGE-AT-0042]|nr:hypothetical protein BKA70DRAFT_67489 [Coprinopsis sp. MPI-PUGE-AT-0042]
MKSVVSKPDSNAQVPPFSSSHTPTSTSTTTSSANSMGRLEHGDSPPQNPAVRLFVTNPSDDSLIDDCTYEDQRGHSSIPGPIGTSYVPPGVQSEYYKEAKSVAVGDANAGGQEAETNVMGTPAPSHTIYGVGGVSFTMDTEDGRLPGYPTPAGMSQLIGDRIQADIKRNAAQAAMEDNDSLKALQLPVLSHIESNTSMEAVKGSPTVSSSSVSKEASSMGISPRDHGPPVSTIFEAVPAKSKGIN